MLKNGLEAFFKGNAVNDLVRVRKTPQNDDRVELYAEDRTPVNQTFTDINAIVTIQLNDEILELCSRALQTGFRFRLDGNDSFVLNTNLSSTDPFKDKYPVTVKMSGFGMPRSYVPSLGHSAILGFISSSNGKVSAAGQYFRGDDPIITLELFADTMEQIVFENDYYVSVIMNFKLQHQQQLP
jgi:hypothetical protein